MGTAEVVLETKDLGYAYVPGRFAVRHLDLQLHRGEVLGLLGRNGAGKTTTVRVLTTLLPLTEGQSTILGMDLRTGGRELRRRMGVVLQAESLDFVSVERNLTLYAFLWGVPREVAKTRAEEMLELFELQEVRHRRPWAMSGGQRRRFQVARELMHDMDILFLDEPTSGLDALARQRILGYLKERARRGLSIVFTTHILHEADALCDRIAVLDHGTRVALGTAPELKRKYAGARTVTVEFVGGLPAKGTDLLATLTRTGVPFTEVSRDGSQIQLKASRAEDLVAALFRWAQENGTPVERLGIREATLEEAFLGMISQDATEEEA